MKCAICGITIDSIEEATEQGWEPYFYDGETEHEFACATCAEKILQMDQNGEMEVKPEYRGKLTYHDQKEGQGKHLMVGIVILKDEDDPNQ